MSNLSGQLARTGFLARVALGSSFVREALRLCAVLALSAAAGIAAAWVVGTWAVSASALTAAVVAALVGGCAYVIGLRRLHRAQASDFARAARRLGQEKTALAELRTACRRLGGAIERSVPEIISENDSRDTWSGSPSLKLDTPTQTRDRRLADRLLRIARAAAFLGGADLELKRLALAGPCAEVIEQYRRLVDSEQEILYVEDGGGDWLAAPLDRPLFVLAIRELLDNVLEHGGDWNRITVTTEPIAGAILLRVRDDGRGIGPDTMTEIISGRTPGNGGGLGLLVVRAVVEAHGGQFRLESHVDQGTNVSLKFPTHV